MVAKLFPSQQHSTVLVTGFRVFKEIPFEICVNHIWDILYYEGADKLTAQKSWKYLSK